MRNLQALPLALGRRCRRRLALAILHLRVEQLVDRDVWIQFCGRGA